MSNPKITIKARAVTPEEAPAMSAAELPTEAAQVLVGKRFEYAIVAANDLVIAPEAQRAERPHWTAYLTRNFSWALTGTLTTHRRPGGEEVVLEGQHRVLAARNSGHGDDQAMRIIRYFDLNQVEEAILFRALNNTLRVGAIDDFRQAQRAGDPVALGVAAVFDKYGIDVGKPGDVKSFMAVKTALNLFAAWPKEFELAVSVLDRAWNLPGVAVPPNWMNGMILHGLTNAIVANGENFDPDHAVKQLQDKVASPNSLIAKFRGRASAAKGPVYHHAQAEITDLYNQGLRQGSRRWLPPVATWKQAERARSEDTGKWEKKITYSE